jgi:2-hydroxymuconate-semialdehyde hydrolase
MSDPTDFSADSIGQTFGYRSRWMSTREGECIHYLDEGPRDGQTVLLVHGSAIGITAAANFYLTIPALVQAGYRVLAPDLYGYGWTEAAPGVDARRAHHVEQLLRMLDALGVARCYLIGNSLGGMVSAALAIAHPERVLGNIVIGTAGASWPGGSRFAPRLSAQADAGAYHPDMVRKAMRHLVDNEDMIPPALVDYRTRMAERPGAYARHLESTRLREQSKRDFPFDRAAAQRCPVPTLFIYGREDRVNPPEDALAGAEAFPHADLMLFGHCGHWTMVERADDFNALMLRFLSGYDRRIVQPPVRAGDLFGRDLVTEGARA